MSTLTDHVNETVDTLVDGADDPEAILDLIESAVAARRTPPIDLSLIDTLLLDNARSLCAESILNGNVEYVRGCAELIIDSTLGLSQDEHKQPLIDFLGGPL